MKLLNLFEGLKFPIYSTREAELEKTIDTSVTSAPEQQEDNQLCGYNNTTLNYDAYFTSRNEMILHCRKASYLPEITQAIEEITNEVFVFDEIENPVELNLDEIDLPDSIKLKIFDSFSKILYLLDFGEQSDVLFKQFYTDGVLNIETVFDNARIREGIKKLILLTPFNFNSFIDPETGEKKYAYLMNNQNRFSNKSEFKVFLDDQITSVHSGIWDINKQFTISYLTPALKTINNLNLIEESLVIHRITRSPEKRQFKIPIKNLNKSKAEEYLNAFMNKFKQKKIYNTDTGTIENRTRSISVIEDYWMPVDACLALDTKIKLLDGRDLELSNIITEVQSGKELWTYSTSPEGRVVPGKISYAKVTRKNAEVMKIVLDNDEEIIATPDHKFILRDGTKCEAKDLVVGSSLMAGYFKRKKIYYSKNTNGYMQIFDNELQKYLTVHTLVSDYFNGEKEKTEVVHHIDMNKFNNTPSNLKIMDKKEHWFFHSKAGTNAWNNANREEHCKHLSIAMKEYFATEEGKELIKRNTKKRRFRYENDPVYKENILKGAEKRKEKIEELKKTDYELYTKKFRSALGRKQASKLAFNEIVFNIFKDVVDSLIHTGPSTQDIINELSKNELFLNEIKQTNVIKANWFFGKHTLKKMLKQFKYSGLKEYIIETYGYYFVKNQFSSEPIPYNHKVKEIIYLDERMDTGTISVDKEEVYHNYHNFLLSSGVFVMNSGVGPTVEILQGSTQNFSTFEDVDYFTNKVYKALHIPLNRRAPDSRHTIGNQIDIEKDELKFFKFILKLRKRFNGLFIDLLKKDLIATNVLSIDDWRSIQDKIKFRYANSNEYSEIKNNQILSMRIDTANSAQSLVEGKLLSNEYIQKKILQLSEEDIEEIRNQNTVDTTKKDDDIEPDSFDGGFEPESMSDDNFDFNSSEEPESPTDETINKTNETENSNDAEKE